MSATTDIYVTPSTSLVLLKSLSSVTNVYLPSFTSNVPSFSVTIRDTTGLPSIRTTPVRISTIQSATFLDGTNYYALDRPYGLVNVSLRNSNTWQINHTSGKPPASAAANVGVLSTNTSYFSILSSSQKFISTYIVENLTTPNSVIITSPFLVASLSTPGFVLLNQTLYVRDNVTLFNTLNVSGPVRLLSSLYTEGFAPVTGGEVIAYSSIGIGGTAYLDTLRIKSTLTLHSTIQVSTLQVTTSSIQDTVLISQTLTAAGLVSTLGNFAAWRTTTIGSDASLMKEISTVGGRFSTSYLSVENDVSTLGALSSIASLGATTRFVSSLSGQSSLFVRQTITFESTLGVVMDTYTSSFSSLSFSTLGNVSTNRLLLLSSATMSGTISTSFLQSYQYISIGGSLFTPGSISSLSNTQIRGTVNLLGSATMATAHTSSSVGVGGDIQVLKSTQVSFLTVEGDFQTKDMNVRGYSQLDQSLGVGGAAFVYGNLTVLGEPTISSFLVESFLLSNLQIMTSSPFVSFAVSSLNASTLQTDFTRIQAALPDIYTVSSTYASTTQFAYAVAENVRLETVYTDSFFLGDGTQLSLDSSPRFVLNVKSQFAEGISSLHVIADTVVARGRIEGNAIGSVSYLSNVPAPFPFFSAIQTYVSTATLSNLYTSSFTASTLTISKLTNVYSTVITPYLVFEAQGFEPRYDTNQFLTLDAKTMVVNRSLTFDRLNNRIGLFQSTPLYDMDISGQVYATNFYFSSINLLNISTTGSVVYSTIRVSSSYVRDSLSYGTNGLQLNSQGSPFTINTAVSSAVNSFGLYDCVEQSTIFLNTALQIGRGGVGVNGANIDTGEFNLPTHALTVTDTMRAEEVYVSTFNLLQSLQTTSLVSPLLTINCNSVSPLNTLSASVTKLYINGLMTIQTNLYEANRYVGIGTSNPTAPLDIRGGAFFSTLYAFEQFEANYVAIASQEF